MSERTPPVRDIDPQGRRRTVYQVGTDGRIERWVSEDGCRTWTLSYAKTPAEYERDRGRP